MQYRILIDFVEGVVVDAPNTIYTTEQFNTIFSSLKGCYASEAALYVKDKQLYLKKCNQDRLGELFLYIYALNDWEQDEYNNPEENAFLTLDEFNSIISRVLEICHCEI